MAGFLKITNDMRALVARAVAYKITGYTVRAIARFLAEAFEETQRMFL